ncbi:MAG: type II toxin-antitoxin system PemK/MazF family toxin [Acidobacteria bacterium]|nr:type II toxin-antitoxin system PemK/MazF family toxin [Acidobacteriota bacterium]
MDYPQVGREQAKRRPGLVLTDRRYNRASRLAIILSADQPAKTIPFLAAGYGGPGTRSPSRR